MAMISMESNETKKCRIVPSKYNYIPDLLLRGKRIEEEITMELNPKEIQRAMTLADVFAVAEDGTETLLTPLNFYLKEETTEDSEEESGSEEPEEPGDGTEDGEETEDTEPEVPTEPPVTEGEEDKTEEQVPEETTEPETEETV